MEKNRPDYFDERYNGQSNLLDGLYEFHPEYFNELQPEEFRLLQTYYLFAASEDEIPDNIFEYRIKLLRKDPSLQPKAKNIYDKLLKRAGIEES